MSELIKPALAALAHGQAPDAGEMADAFTSILSGEATAAQIGGFLMGIEQVGVTGAMIAAGAAALRHHMVPVPFNDETIDVCGTGGDGAHTLNISTAVSLVLAGCGVKVAKHGNRAMSSKSGAADVLESLGVNLNVDPGTQASALAEAGVCFMFAQAHHPAMRHVAGPRRELGMRTIFNLLGPLSNPAGARRQLVGVFSPDKMAPMAEALRSLGAASAWIVHGDGGLDEIALSGPTQVVSLKDGEISQFSVSPDDAGLPCAPLDAIKGGDAAHNADALKALLDGATGPYRDMVLVNTAGALIVAGRAQDLRAGVDLARQSLDEGHAKRALDRLISISQGASA